MPNYSKARIQDFLNRSDAAANPDAKGRIFEDLVVYLMDKFHGVRVAERNVLDATGSQELDVVFWNNRVRSPFDFLDPILISECKNEANPLSSAKCREFVAKLRSRGANTGLLITSSGIAGQLNGYRFANSVIMDALTADRIKVIVIDRTEILALNNTDDLINLITDKYLNLTLRRTLD
ncbi:restriction endonuclease [Pseudoflavitalea rhizosphaerae]|uniref:restriction endonuclease n=1 Tax=Pseudoflavitalea rhizosphaerae TaxID=1884793 RepID=UPI000F8DB5BE|nr:restriction endonuclease [Pseudoflavitalea rhizosphaerae]